MNKLQKIILCFIIGLLFFFLRFIFPSQTLPYQIIPMTWEIDLLFFTPWTTAEALVKNQLCTTAINGSYFEYDQEGHFLPAGIWETNGEKIYHTERKENDVNLTNTIYFQKEPFKVTFYFDRQPTESEKKEKETWIFFNAGPRLLQDSSINEQLQKGLSHRSYPTQRTVIAKKESQTFLLLFKEKITLMEVAQELKKQNFESAINLDGGPSTSFASSKMHEQFNEKKVLPIFFCIK